MFCASFENFTSLTTICNVVFGEKWGSHWAKVSSHKCQCLHVPWISFLGACEGRQETIPSLVCRARKSSSKIYCPAMGWAKVNPMCKWSNSFVCWSQSLSPFIFCRAVKTDNPFPLWQRSLHPEANWYYAFTKLWNNIITLHSDSPWVRNSGLSGLCVKSCEVQCQTQNCDLSIAFSAPRFHWEAENAPTLMKHVFECRRFGSRLSSSACATIFSGMFHAIFEQSAVWACATFNRNEQNGTDGRRRRKQNCFCFIFVWTAGVACRQWATKPD